MGNDKYFIEADNLPFRFIDIPTGTAPPPPSSSSPTNCRCDKNNKHHGPPLPPIRFDGYDAPPSLPPPPPPTVPKRYDEPIISIALKSDHHQTSSLKSGIYKRRKKSRTKLLCCQIS